MSFIIENGVLKPETNIVIPDGVTRIGDHAFEKNIHLQSIEIPNSVTSIGDYAFYGCFYLQSIKIPDSVTSIGNYAFSVCSRLQSITIPDSVTSIGNYAFSHCSQLQLITIPDSVTSINDFAFCRCKNLQSITIPNSVTSIGDHAFENCENLQSITIPDNGIYIGRKAFTSVCGKFTFKSKDFHVSIPPCRSWGERGEEKRLARFYNDPTINNFKKIKKTRYKIPMALLRFFGHNEEEYRDYIKRNITRIADWIMDENDCVLMNKILAAGFVTKNNIDQLIYHAGKKEQTEIAVLLKEHKNKHIVNASTNKEM